MKRLQVFSLLLIMLFVTGVQAAKIETYQFSDTKQERIYKRLIEELRCLVCQNQNLADSNAELAQDLRRETYEMASSGMSEDEIVDYMVERYGDFVLYKPPVQTNTILLWVGPFIIFAVGFIVLIRFIRRKPAVDAALSEEQRAQAEKLLSDQESGE